MRFFQPSLIFTALLLVSRLAQAVPVITNAPSFTGDNIGSFTSVGGTGATIIGQDFVATGSEVQLDSFSLSIFNGGAQAFRAYVQQWDAVGNVLVGGVLFQSAIQNTVVGANVFNTGGLLLTPGTHYLAYFSTIGAGLPAPDNDNFSYIATPPVNANLGGLHYSNVATIGDNSSWDYNGSFASSQLLFTANLSAAFGAPELDGTRSTLPLMCAGILFACGVRRRR